MRPVRPERKCGERRERWGELPSDENYSRHVDTHKWWMMNRYALLLDLIDTDVSSDETKDHYGRKQAGNSCSESELLGN